jgi:hypothetical protein
MGAGRGGSDVTHLGKRRLTERTTRCREDDPFDGMALMFFQHLINRIVLAVDRQQLTATGMDGTHEQIAGRNQAFLVGKRDIGAAPRCSQRRGKTRGADNGGHNPASVALGSFDQAVAAGRDFDAGSGQRRLEIFILAFICRHGELGARCLCLFGKQRNIAVAGQCGNVERIASAKLSDDVERVGADRAR